MSDLVVSVSFTQSRGQPATGLTLTDIDITLSSINKSTGAVAAVWNTENPTAEVSNVGAYIRVYASADLDTYAYVAAAEYTGATSLDCDHVGGAASAQLDEIAAILADTGTDGVVLADDAITAAKIATNAIDAGAIAADAIGQSELATTAVEEIVAAVWAGLTTAAKQAIADEVLSRDATNVEDSADNNSLAELIMAALNSAIVGTTWTIKKPSDDSTFNTRTVTTDSGADPITGVT
jgi:hypothetical protein